ncbi:MAG: hypothetical protein ACJ78Q_13090 [Chloroflexia bacterium]
MASRELDEIIRRADLLTTEEQLRLIAHLAEKARENYQATTPRRRWSEIRGAVPFPAMGEDAQK